MKRHGHEVLACLDIPYEEGTQLFIVLSLLVGASIRGRSALTSTMHMRLFGIAFVIAFHQILNFFFAKIECGLYFLDRFDVLMSKIIFKK